LVAIGSFSEWSDHAPFSFTLKCNNVTPNVLENKGIRFKRNVNLREQFRTGENIISIVDKVDCSSRDSVNVMLNEFSEIIRVVADPLFSKSCYSKNKTGFKIQKCI